MTTISNTHKPTDPQVTWATVLTALKGMPRPTLTQHPSRRHSKSTKSGPRSPSRACAATSSYCKSQSLQSPQKTDTKYLFHAIVNENESFDGHAFADSMSVFMCCHRFLFGWFFPILWYAGAFIPLCVRRIDPRYVPIWPSSPLICWRRISALAWRFINGLLGGSTLDYS